MKKIDVKNKNMNYNILIIICIVIILLIILLSIDNVCYYEHFDVEYRKCKLYREETELCKSKYANVSELQLIYKILTEPEKEKLKEIYELKSKMNFLPCNYEIDNFEEIDVKAEEKIPYKIINSETYVKNAGIPITNSECYEKEKRIIRELKQEELEKTFATNSTSKILFNTLNLEKLKNTICRKENIDIFLKREDGYNSMKFYKIIFNKSKIDIINDKYDILFKDISVVQYNNVSNTFEKINEQSEMEYISKLFTISYDNQSIYFVPYKRKYNIYIFEKNICENYGIKEIVNDKTFDLSMLGILKLETLISKENNGLQMNNENKIYNLLSSSKGIDESKNKLYEIIDEYNEKLLENKKNEFESCRDKHEIVSNNLAMEKVSQRIKHGNTSAITKNIEKIEKKIEDINKFLYLLRTNPNDFNIYNYENKAINHCKYTMNNKVDLKLIYDDFNICQNQLGNIKSDLENEETKSDQIKEKIDILENQISNITSFMGYVDENKLLNKSDTYTPAVVSKLDRYSDDISSYCSIKTLSGYTIKEMKMKMNKLMLDIENARITREILKEMNETKVSNHLLEYVSEDDSIYIQITE